MKKPYILIATVNGHDLPTKRYASFEKAYKAMSHIMDDYHLQLANEFNVSCDDVYRMEQYRSWFRIRYSVCNA